MKAVRPAADTHDQPAATLVTIVQLFLPVGFHPCLMPSNSRRWRSAFSLVAWRE